ncbi:MAG TPA: hypothetical protein VHB77_08970, partial [Planctomycetaceae bacterium]|nr:hypothetical protein [Planctomycetaceae bacterium]
MNLASAPLFAVGGEVVPLIMFAVFVISWVLKLVTSNKPQTEPPVRRPGRPVRPRDGRVEDEIDIFIQEVDQQRSSPQRPKPPSKPPAKASSGKRRPEPPAPAPPPAARRRVGEDMDRTPLVDPKLGQGVRNAAASVVAGERQLDSGVQQHLADRIEQSVEQHLGTFSGNKVARTEATPAHRLRLALSSKSIRQAILINEILSPPKGLRREP